jgi:hypothetical protein
MDQKGVPSISSDRAIHDLNPRPPQLDHPGNDEEKQRLSDDLETRENDDLLPKEKQAKQSSPKSSIASGLFWMVVNTVATIGIVYNLPLFLVSSLLSPANHLLRSSPTKPSSPTPP